MEYIAIPRVGDNRFLLRSAKVAYKSAKDTKARELLSTMPYIDILSTRQNIELHLVKVVRFSCNAIVAFTTLEGMHFESVIRSCRILTAARLTLACLSLTFDDQAAGTFSNVCIHRISSLQTSTTCF